MRNFLNRVNLWKQKMRAPRLKLSGQWIGQMTTMPIVQAQTLTFWIWLKIIIFKVSAVIWNLAKFHLIMSSVQRAQDYFGSINLLSIAFSFIMIWICLSQFFVGLLVGCCISDSNNCSQLDKSQNIEWWGSRQDLIIWKFGATQSSYFHLPLISYLL